MRKLVVCIFVSACIAVFAQKPIAPADAGYEELDKAYQALRTKDYETAIAWFNKAAQILPDRPSIRKDLGYTFLKIGENETARDQFAEAMRLDPGDEHIALEYAFLCYETKKPVEARRVFAKYRAANPTAAEAFENIDRPLREGIARWQEALRASPNNFSGEEELAKLLEQREEIASAAEHYEKAWRMRSERRDLLLTLGRLWKQLNREEDAISALLAVSRGPEPRGAEQARELLPGRYPFPYEFERALTLDPTNQGLRRELAYLQLEMNQRSEAETLFEDVVQHAPDDLLSVAQLGFLRLAHGDTDGAMPLLNRVLEGNDEALADRVRTTLRLPQTLKGRPEVPKAQVTGEAKDLAFKSLEKGYLQDALKYLNIAHENDPVDFEVILKLGWAYNATKNDQSALNWFSLARRSPDPKISTEAARAYRNLAPGLERFRTTVWVFPTYSSRWRDLFAYAQAKTELRIPHWKIRPYLSVRFVGDTHGAVSPGVGFAPQYLSEGAATLGVGVATDAWHGVSGWFEAGEQMRYRPSPADQSLFTPDYRGGATYAKGFGKLLAQGAHGLFTETNDDAVYVSRFDKDTLFYTQNRLGYTLRSTEGFGGLHSQVYWNVNLTGDMKRQYWANFFEMGPGLRFRFERFPSLLFSVNAVRGTYTINEGNPRGVNFTDLRLGVWYAFTR